MEQKQNTKLSIRFSEEQYEQITNFCTEHEISRSDFIKMSVDLFFGNSKNKKTRKKQTERSKQQLAQNCKTNHLSAKTLEQEIKKEQAKITEAKKIVDLLDQRQSLKKEKAELAKKIAELKAK